MSQHPADTTHTTPLGGPVGAAAPAPPGAGRRRAMARGQRVLGRRALPGAVRASDGLPRAEVVVFVAVVPLLSVPVLLASTAAAWAAGITVVLTAAVAWLCLARRVAIGTGWLADRRLLHYRVTRSAQLRSVDLVENGHGGVLRLHPHQGRAHRLRRSDGSYEARSALAALVADGRPVLGAGVRVALGAGPAAPAAPAPSPAGT